ncbi:unnamed protein product [Gordionus sp. m RMFG-2023]
MLPELLKSDILHSTVITEKSNHARELVQNLNINEWHGIITISGDGLIHEVINGLMARNDWEEAIKIPIGVIPAGTGNALHTSLCHQYGKYHPKTFLMDCVNFALHGEPRNLDLFKITTQSGQVYYSILGLCWGLIADIDIESQIHRYMGSLRYMFHGFKRIQSLRHYRGSFVYRDEISGQLTNIIDKISTVPSVYPSKFENFDNYDKKKLPTSQNKLVSWLCCDCIVTNPSLRNNHDKESVGRTNRVIKAGVAQSYKEMIKKGFDNPLYVLDTAEPERVPESVKENHANLNIGDVSSTANNIVNGVARSHFPGGHHTPVDIISLYVCNLSHISQDFSVTPMAKMNDGLAHLCVLKSGVSKSQMLKFLLNCIDVTAIRHACSFPTKFFYMAPVVSSPPIHTSLPRLSAVSAVIEKVRAYRLPFSSSKTNSNYRYPSILTIDGEAIPCCSVVVEVLPSMARILA